MARNISPRKLFEFIIGEELLRAQECDKSEGGWLSWLSSAEWFISACPF